MSPAPRRLIAGTLLLALVASGCGSRRPMATRTPHSGTWPELARLSPSSSVRVETGTGLTTGRLLHVDDRGLSVSHRDGVSRIGRDDVRRVIVRERQAGRKARWGFGIGAALGLLTAGITTDSSQGAFMLLLAGGWGAIGAGIGAIDGAGDIREVVVYDAFACCPS